MVGNSKYLVAVVLVAIIGGGIFIALKERPKPQPAPVTASTQAPTPAAAPAAQPTADCLAPHPLPPVPDGATAGLVEMKMAHDLIQNFVLKLEAYQACRDNMADHAPPGVSTQQKQTWVAQGDSAIDAANALAAAFSVQLKIFQARNPQN